MRSPNALVLGWRQFQRDWRSGDIRLLMVCIALAVSALTSVAFFANRIDLGLQDNAKNLIGGDAVVISDQLIPEHFLQEVRNLNLDAIQSVTFPTMARAQRENGGAIRLVALKTVEPGYPLRGQLVLQPQQSVSTPLSGEAWVDQSLLDTLGLQLGDEILLGDTLFRMTAVIIQEPDRGIGFTAFSPRVMIAQADLLATDLIQPASRVRYRLMVAALNTDLSQVEVFTNWVEDTIASQSLKGIRLESLRDGRPAITETLDTAQNFLGLTALLTALLSALAIGMVARAFAWRQLDTCAMLRVLGLTQSRMAWSYLVEFMVIGLFASVLGIAVGFIVHTGLVVLLGSLLVVGLPPPNFWPIVLGLGIGLCLVLAFGLPPVLQLARTPALRVIRRDLLASPKWSAVLTMVSGVVGLCGLLFLGVQDAKLAGVVVIGFAIAMLVFALSAFLCLYLLQKLFSSQYIGTRKNWLNLALKQLISRKSSTLLQVSGLSLGLLALMLLILLQTDLVKNWRQITPENAPNRFVINILPDQANAVQQRLAESGIVKPDYDWYPMFRGRLVAINDEPVQVSDYADSADAERLLNREFNLSNTATLPDHNQLVAGRWKGGEPIELSIEESVAEAFSIELNDRLTFDIAGLQKSAIVTSIREVDWASMRANFYVLFPVNSMDVPFTYMAVFKSPMDIQESRDLDRYLVSNFPNVTIVDTTQTIIQVQQVLNTVILAVQLLFVFSLLAGGLVLLASLNASTTERSYHLAVMRALGATKQTLAKALQVELLLVGALAGILAGLVAIILATVLIQWIFNFGWQWSIWPLFMAIFLGISVAYILGWWMLKPILKQPVLQNLRVTL
jgi:putative ABC transport system permease protein